jgi:hypothetical protein
MTMLQGKIVPPQNSAFGACKVQGLQACKAQDARLVRRRLARRKVQDCLAKFWLSGLQSCKVQALHISDF